MSTVKQTVQLPLSLKIDFPLEDGRVLTQGPLTYNQDGLATRHNCDFLTDSRFMRAYQRGQNSGHGKGELHIEWRVQVAIWAALHGRHLPGDYVECGVSTGFLSLAVMDYLEFHTMPEGATGLPR